MKDMQQIVPSLWFDQETEEAINYYVPPSTARRTKCAIPGSSVSPVTRKAWKFRGGTNGRQDHHCHL